MSSRSPTSLSNKRWNLFFRDSVWLQMADDQDESREAKLKRWLEEKKTRLQAEREEKELRQPGSVARSSTVKRGGSVARRRVASSAAPQATPNTAISRRRGGGEFSRFGATEDSMATPVQNNSSSSRRQAPSSNLKTPTNRGTDSLTSQESLDKRRAFLERKTLSSSSRKTGSRSVVRQGQSSTRKQLQVDRESIGGASSLSTSSSSVKKRAQPDSVSRSARRREAVSRTTRSANVDMADVAHVRETLFFAETVLLQWAYLEARIERVITLFDFFSSF